MRDAADNLGGQIASEDEPVDPLSACHNANFVAESLIEYAGYKREIVANAIEGDYTVIAVSRLARWAEVEESTAAMLRRLVGVIERLRTERQHLADTGYDLSTWAASIEWDDSPNGKDWLRGLRDRIVTVQEAAGKAGVESGGMRTEGPERYLGGADKNLTEQGVNNE